MRQLLKLACFVFLLLLTCFTALGQSSSYTIRYASTIRYFTAEQQLTTTDESSILIGKWGDREDPSDLLVIKVDKSGELIWSKRVAVNLRLYTYNSCQLSDGSIVIVGDILPSQPPYLSTLLMVKLNCKGELVWSKELSKPHPDRLSLDPMSVQPGKNGDVIISFYNQGWQANQFLVFCRVNASGDLVWSKTFYSSSKEWAYPSVAYLKGNKIVAFGHKRVYTNFRTDKGYAFFALSLNYDNGSLEDIKAFEYNEFNTGRVLQSITKNHFNVEPLSDGRTALFGIFHGLSSTDAFFYKVVLNEDLTLNQSKYFTIPYELALGSQLNVLPNGNTSFLTNYHDAQTRYWYMEDNNGRKIREKKAPYPFANSYIDRWSRIVQKGINQARRIYNVQTNSRGYIEVAHMDETDAGSACPGTDTSFITSQPMLVTPTSFSQAGNWSSIADNEVVVLSRNDQVYDVAVTKTIVCGQPAAQDKPFEISGDANICASQQEVIYTVKTKRGQPLKASWVMDPTYYQSLTPLNDSMVSIKFKAPSTTPQEVKLYARVGNCQVIEDYKTITLHAGTTHLADTLIFCNTPIRLQLGNGFKSYKWQDGSTDATYTVQQPGIYWVTTQTFCNTTFTDSVLVLSGTTGISTSTSGCTNDTLMLSAPGGFVNYSWSPAYNLKPLSENVVQVFPEKDTAYVLSAITPDGCPLKDTIHVTINKPRNINLEKELTICSRDILTLDAGSGFRNYLWSTGGTSQKEPISTPGLYWIKAIDANGCQVDDTITIKTKECPNSIHVPTAFTPNNDGKNDIFRPKIEGRIEAYELTIFNRWGEVVFKTSQRDKGWDGYYKGKLQRTDIFIWVCSYQFTNGEKKRETGSLSLIH